MSVDEMEKTVENSSWANNQTKVLKSNQSKPNHFRNSSHSVKLLEVLQSLRKYVFSNLLENTYF